MYLLIVMIPLLNFLMISLFARYIGKKIIIFSIYFIFLTSFLSFFIFYEVVLCHSICSFKLFTWIESNILLISWGFLFDNLTAVMLIVVTFISALVHLYSYGYMSTDPHLPRFMSYLSLFTFFMLMLVTSDNYVQLFLGWEGVGLVSYLLINFWHTRIQANKAAMKAIIVNKIGDFSFSLGLALIFYSFFSFDFFVVFNLASEITNENIYLFGYFINKITFISLLLFIGAMGKSAQLGLHVWLPDAMEGPTPVSALIHAATMVTAGVFLILRSSPIIEYSDFTLSIITVIGALTAFLAATIGIVQHDLKKVIAYSTCSQLGYMIFACGLSNYSVSLFHLMNHAFFKALLFLSAGSVIHAMSGEQDMRKMGGLLKLIPITYIMVLIGSLALIGFPFLSGYFSKDILLELSEGTYHFTGLFPYWLGLCAAFCTSFYSVRLIILTFIQKSKGSKYIMKNVHESPMVMLIPLFALFFGSLFIGFLFKDLFLGLGVDTWNTSLFTLSNHISFYESEFIDPKIKLVAFLYTLSGVQLSIFIYTNFSYYMKYNKFINYKFIYPIYSFISSKYSFDKIYLYFIVDSFFYFGYKISFKRLDRGLLEYLGPIGIIKILSFFSKKVSNLQSGFLYHYAFIMIVGISSFILLIFLPIFLKMGSLLSIYIYYIYLMFLKNIKSPLEIKNNNNNNNINKNK